MTSRKPYLSDLSDAQWERIAFLFPDRFPDRSAGMGGRPREYSWREIVHAILYLNRTGCQWRYQPHDLLPYDLVSHYFHLWRKTGLLECLHDLLRSAMRQHGRWALGRNVDHVGREADRLRRGRPSRTDDRARRTSACRPCSKFWTTKRASGSPFRSRVGTVRGRALSRSFREPVSGFMAGCRLCRSDGYYCGTRTANSNRRRSYVPTWRPPRSKLSPGSYCAGSWKPPSKKYAGIWE